MVKASFVFLPLYLYPYNTSSWSAIEQSIAASPNLDFEIVVAPNLAEVYPDQNYETALEALNNYTNVRTLGYVYTSWGARNISEVEYEVDCYAAWGTNGSNPRIAIQGIFFDEAPSLFNNDTFNYMNQISTYAKDTLGVGRRYITINPGVPIDSAFYDMADNVIIFEDSWAQFNATAMSQVPWNVMAKSTYLIHSFTEESDTQAVVVNDLTNSNVAGLLVTTSTTYDEVSTLWPDLCQDLADLNEGIGVLDANGQCINCADNSMTISLEVVTQTIFTSLPTSAPSISLQ